jgi:16S rRNA (cytosine1402-N4)-methyltransferase
MIKEAPHISVMLKEFLHFFHDRTLKVFFEGTVGAAGHAKALLEAHPEIEKYIGCDQDPVALKIAQDNLTPWKSKVRLERGNFSHLDEYLKRNKVQQVDGFFLTWGYRLCN